LICGRQQASRCVDLKPHPVGVLPAVLPNAPFAKLEILTAERP
jgi:hypothetical protein